MNAHEESPDRFRHVRDEHDSDVLSSGSVSRPARYSWLQLCMISSVGLAVGVVGTTAYVLWFSRDQQAYTEAIQAAHRAPPATATAPVVQNNAVSGRITPAAPPDGNTHVALAAAQAETSVAPNGDAQKAACPTPAATVNPPARADRGKLVASANRKPPPRVKPKETLASRLSSMFHPVGYHNRGTGNNPDPYSHP